MKNIVHVTGQHALSGIGRYGYELTAALREMYPDLRWYKPYKKDHPDAYLHNESWIKGYNYKSFRNLHAYVLPYFIRWALRSSKADYLHAHWFLSGLGAVKSRVTDRVMVTMHDVSLLHISEQNEQYTNYYKKVIALFKSRKIPIITVSEQARKDAIYYADYPEELVFAVHNGINHEQFFSAKRPTSTERDRLKLIYAGGLGKRKNVDMLLRVFKRIEKQYSHVDLSIIGAHPERTGLPELAQKLSIQNISFPGFLPDEQMADFYRSADLLVFPSSYEGFGFTPLEAMACGTPVVCANGGALSETAGGGALMSDLNDDDLESKIKQMIDSEELRKQYAQKGIQWAQKFTWEKAAQKQNSIYREIWG